MALFQVRQLPEIIQDVHTWSALPTRQSQFYRYCQAEEEKRERGRQGRQSEIYAQRDDAVSALLAREPRLLRPHQTPYGLRNFAKRTYVFFSDRRIYRHAEIERGIVKYSCGFTSVT